jgi:hypothetical protein
MKQRIHDALLGIVGIAGVAFFALSGASCEAPAIQCVVAHGQFVSYFAKYELTSGDAACYGLDGENIAMAVYLQPTADGKFADFNNRQIAIRSETMGAVFTDRQGAGGSDADVPHAIGDYTPTPDDNDLCYAGGTSGTTALAASEVNAAQFDTGELDPDTMMPIILPEQHYRQEWKNVKIYVTAGVPGTQAVGEMRFDDFTSGCFAEYKFTALFPSVGCENIMHVDVHVDDDMDPATPDDNDQDDDPETKDVPEEQETGMPFLDEALCNPKPDENFVKPALGTPYKPVRVFGSGINPDFKTTCDATVAHCVLKPESVLIR